MPHQARSERVSRSSFFESGFLFLILLGVLGNVLKLPLFFGVDFIFGSIATMIAISFYGKTRGVLVAIASALYTVYLWHHGYAAIVLVGEAVFVAASLTRFRSSVALASGCYWLLLGIPQVLLYYRFGLAMDMDAALLASLKQGMNGIVNAIIASLLITYVPFIRTPGSKIEPRLSVFQSIFNSFILAALLPAMALVMLDARATVDRLEQETSASLETISTGITVATERWRSQHLNAILLVARLAERVGDDRAHLQNIALSNRKTWPDFHGTFFTDAKGKTIAFDPPVNTKGESTIGIDFSDRAYFQELKAGGPTPQISTVFMARGGVFEPVLNVTSSYRRGGHFGGVASGSLNLRHLSEILSSVPGESGFYATLIDSAGTVIASTDPNHRPLERFEIDKNGSIAEKGRGYYHRWPLGEQLAPMARWQKSWLGKFIEVPGLGHWRLLVEMPLAPLQSELYTRYIASLGSLLGLALVILLGSHWVAARIARPLAQLSAETTNIPARLGSTDPIRWPSTRLIEMNSLVENFKQTVEALKKRFYDLEASRAQLDQANRMKDEFLATLSHELRTPLNVILGHTELLKSEARGLDEEAWESLEAIQRNAMAQNQIVADLLDVSAIILGKLSLNDTLIAPDELVLAAVENVRPAAVRKGLQIGTRLEPVRHWIRGDAVRLQQVVWNLLSNAVKFTPQGGTIEVSTSVTGNKYAIKVSDTGEGIDPAFLPNVFDRFRQEDSSTSRRHGGLGLGLSIVRQLVEQHGGSVSVASGGRNKGSVFTVTLPLSTEKAEELVPNAKTSESPAGAPSVQSDGPSLKDMRILVVDDDADARALATRFLEREGARVECASTAQEGLKSFLAFRPDVVISDIGMPGEDGFFFLSHLRALESREGIKTPVAALTAFARDTDTQRIMAAGFQAHVTKPVRKDELTRTVARLAQGSNFSIASEARSEAIAQENA